MKNGNSKEYDNSAVQPERHYKRLYSFFARETLTRRFFFRGIFVSVRTRTILKLLITFLTACLVTFLLYFTVHQVMALIDTAGEVRLLFLQRLIVSTLIMSLFFTWLSSKKFPVRFIIALLASAKPTTF